jgi:hypothetical protein
VSWWVKFAEPVSSAEVERGDGFSFGLAAGRVRLWWVGFLLELRLDVVLLDEGVDRNSFPARVDDGLGDWHRVDLLDSDVERVPGTVDEVDDRPFKVVGGAELNGADVNLDLVIGEALHLAFRGR